MLSPGPASPTVACSGCSLRDLCIPSGLTAAEMRRLDGLVSTRMQVRRRGALFRRGDPFTSLYAVRSGMFKAVVHSACGQEQVTGFHMAGEILGMEGIDQQRHTCDAVALEDAQVCVMPFQAVCTLAREIPGVQHQLHRIMSREIVRDHGVMMLMANMRAEQRVAAFLLNLLQRLQARGFSSSELVLRMSRQDIGNYLGLTLETVSRALSRFASDGWIEVRHRHIRIPDAEVRTRWQAQLQGL